jgi:tetratricopeptide (TPR) repeat protein
MQTLQQVDSAGNVDYNKALILFDNSIKLDFGNIESRYWKSQCEVNLGKLDDALQTAKITINKFEKSDNKLMPAFYITAGLIEKFNGNIVESKKYFEKAKEIYEIRIEKDKNNIDAIMNKSIVLCYMDNKEVAIKFVNSVSVDKEKESLLDQIKKQIVSFDTDAVLKKMKK